MASLIGMSQHVWWHEQLSSLHSVGCLRPIWWNGQTIWCCCSDYNPDGDWATFAVALHPGGILRSGALDDARAHCFPLITCNHGFQHMDAEDSIFVKGAVDCSFVCKKEEGRNVADLFFEQPPVPRELCSSKINYLCLLGVLRTLYNVA